MRNNFNGGSTTIATGSGGAVGKEKLSYSEPNSAQSTPSRSLPKSVSVTGCVKFHPGGDVGMRGGGGGSYSKVCRRVSMFSLILSFLKIHISGCIIMFSTTHIL